MKQKDEDKSLATNRTARHQFFIIETFEAGLVLLGSEVKSIRSGNIQLKEGYAKIRAGELWLEDVYIKPYEHIGYDPPDPNRSRKLLIQKSHLKKLDREIALKKLTLVPLKVYITRGRIKVEVGLAKGKQLHDKRDAIKEREQERSLRRLHNKHR